MDVLVVGAGVVGLAIGRALALRGHSVIVAEADKAIGTGVSSRSSEVIHAGMYYPEGSLRARHCVKGSRKLYHFCEKHGVLHRRCGKLIVACDAKESAAIETLRARGDANGVPDLALLEPDEARRLEPNLSCALALLSPHTGIVDSHALMLALLGEIEDRGGAVALRTRVAALKQVDGQWQATFEGDEGGTLPFDGVVNAAGFGAPALAARTEGYPPNAVPRLHLARGNYFGCTGKPAFTRLIYPAPRIDGGLGIHLTLDLNGRVRFGPDVEWIDEPDYRVDPTRAASFYGAIRRYWPDLPEGALFPDYAGLRPKLTGPGEPAADFRVEGPAEHGLPRLVHLFGIESPGLTSSLSLAEDVADRLEA
ncbi:NAD(P)/FAD-dependent oxidoreductase [Methylobacterium persicinum]|uniref:L-2-hydroxyglutarate oxidase LhgO n=1 Tax=Methylobacterium persicinum TaxID=374426 RepID=A0ABU0HIB9_9HYPH|nr:NAD(P)/FAD-dependent oxidoreductase [Methylobacterium persicinum]MDQ0441687.1 L-2-hydroxyglutarate oxidase LhgO [Methylobacterium persicinum]GJE39448.1 L-2-hydroxyglutarate dehydrogenase [Methylobacterium persicinum]